MLVETQIYCLPDCSVGEMAQKENNGLCHYFCLGERCPSRPHAGAIQFSSFPYVPGTCRAAARAGAQSEWVWVIQSTELWLSISLSHNPCWFSHPGVMGTSLLRHSGLGAWCGTRNPHSWRGTFTAEISLLIYSHHLWVWDHPVPSLCPFCQSQCGFFISVVIILLSVHLDSRWFSIMDFYTLVVIVVWL